MTSLTFLWPGSEDEIWSDEAIEGLVGQTPTLKVDGGVHRAMAVPPGRLTITAARRVDGGIEVTAEVDG